MLSLDCVQLMMPFMYFWSDSLLELSGDGVVHST